MKVITIIDLEGMPQGSVLQDCTEVTIDGAKCWQGLWCSMFGSFMETIPFEAAEQYDPKPLVITDEMKAMPAFQAWLKIAQRNSR